MLGLLALFIVGLAFVQFGTPDMPDNDGFYHIKLAALMREQGFKPEFIWLPLSILNAREFYDHHFLFHVFLIPFTFGDLRDMLDNADDLAILEGIIGFANAFARELIAEGVETEDEYRYLAAQGVEYLQGYFFARPATPPPASATSSPSDAAWASAMARLPARTSPSSSV